MDMRVVVTGANRGIGLELARQLAARGDSVVAAVRDPSRAGRARALERALVFPCDVTSDASVAAFADSLTGPVDVLVNNAGVLGKDDAFEHLDFADMLRVYDTNALGAIRMARALLPHLRAGQAKKILNVSTGMGSIADNGSGGSWAYRLSKAALNMATKNLAIELRDDGISCVAVNPGWVRTDMGGAGAPMPVEESARRLLRIVDSMRLDASGSFLNYDGKPYAF
jgi:NAD(P)-dependent dehydrogenase (short-subunit alcohol dehydrogenase family)